MNIANYLQELKSQGIELWLEEGRLRYRGPEHLLTSNVLSQLKEHKAAILQLLSRQLESEIQEHPLSYSQKSLWIIYQQDRSSPAYNVNLALRLRDDVDLQALRRALRLLVERHPMLRTVYSDRENGPVQQVLPTLPHQLEVTQVEGWNDEQRDAWIRAEVDRPFDLGKRCFRTQLLAREQHGRRDHTLVVTIHHIAADFWSFEVLVNELCLLYRAARQGAQVALPALRWSYSEHLRWERERLSGPGGEALWAFWKRQLAGDLPLLNLRTDKPRPPMETHRGQHHTLTLEPQLSRQIRHLARQEGVTPFMLLLAAFEVLLRRYAGQEDILIGLPTAGRNQDGSQHVVGNFVSTVVLRAWVDGRQTFRELLKEVRKTVLQALEHQDFPFPLLVERLNPPRDPSRSPIFQVVYNWNQVHGDDQVKARNEAHQSLIAEVLSSSSSGASGVTHELALTVTDLGESFKLSWAFNTDLYEVDTIRRMASLLEALLRDVFEEPGRRVSSLAVMSAASYRATLGDRAQAMIFPPGACMHSLFEAQAERRPNAGALCYLDQRLTYRELNARANQLAHHLIARGIGPERRVGIMMQRGLNLVIAMLGVLKAGAAYVPVDPVYPTERMRFIIEDTQMPLVLTEQALLDELPSSGIEVIAMDRDAEQLARENTANPSLRSSPDSLAYIIYTSGSTGRPKGALLTHHNIVRLFSSAQIEFGFHEQDVWTLFHSYAFDFSVWEIWGALLHGGRLVVVPYPETRNPQEYRELLLREGVTILNQTPSAFYQLVKVDAEHERAELTRLRYVLLGGEALNLHYLLPWFERYGDELPQLYNMYGITETAVIITWGRVRRHDPPTSRSIGRPLLDLTVYVCDKDLQMQPLGVPGELCVGGAGLGRGYLNRADITAEKFMPDPFSAEPGARLYRSGDLTCLLPNGEIEYLGRLDHQVKIRGYRIELQEIEAVLKELPFVHECTILDWRDAQDHVRLAAYVVPDERLAGPVKALLQLEKSGEREEPSKAALPEDGLPRFSSQSALVEALETALQSRLPSYMVPSAFVLLAEMPLTRNGKVDRRALPQPNLARHTRKEYVAPRSALEEQLAQIWKEVLGLPQISIHDNFFESGGDSLVNLQSISRAAQLGIALTPKLIFEHQTIADLAAALVSRGVVSPDSSAAPAQQESPSALEDALSAGLTQEELNALIARLPGPQGLEAIYPLATLQQAFLTDLGSSPRSTLKRRVVQYSASLKGLSEEAFRTAWEQLVQRHGMLRTFFVAVRDRALQGVCSHVALPWSVDDWSHLPPEQVDSKIEEALDQDQAEGFLFEAAPLMRLRLIRLADGSHRFLWSFHHALLDGWSIDRVLSELEQLYQTASRGSPLELPPVRPYRDYVRWLNAYDARGAEAFWRRYLQGIQSLTPLPLARPQPLDRPEYVPCSLTLVVEDERLVDRLQELARREQVTLNILVQAAWAALLSETSGTTDVLFSTVVSGRPPELSGVDSMVGSFFQVLPVRVRLDPQEDVRSWLKRLYSTQVERQEFEYSTPLQIQQWSELSPGRHFSEAAILVFQKFTGQAEEDGPLDIPRWRHRQPGASPLHVSLIPRHGLTAYVRYDGRVYDDKTIEDLFRRYAAHLQALAEHAGGRVAALLGARGAGAGSPSPINT